MSVDAFAELGLMPELIKALEDLGWEMPTDIQTESIPLILGGGDVMAAAETGSGKTGAFALPILQIVHETLRGIAAGNVDRSELVWLMNDSDRDKNLAIDETGLACQSRAEDKWAGCRATFGVIRGKYYYEASVMDDGLCRVGWATSLASRDIGTDAESFGFGGTGKKSHRRTFEDYGRKYAKGDVIGCFIDCDSGSIEFSINGERQGKAFDVPKNLLGQSAFYPAVCLKNAEMHFNFGGQPFKHAPEQPFLPLVSAASDDTTLAGTGTLTRGRKPLALILEPSRELAEQVHEAIKSFKKYMPLPNLETALFTGGMESKGTEVLASGVDVVCGTVGRIESLINSRQLGLENIKFFVLDEADKLLDPENSQAINRIYARIPKVDASSLQVLMFSATLHSPDIKALSEKICQYPTWVDLKGKDTIPTTVDQGVLICDPTTDRAWATAAVKAATDGVHPAKLSLDTLADAERLSEAIKRLKPQLLKRVIDAYSMEQAMIFVRTKVDADHLDQFFKALNRAAGSMMDRTYSCASLHGGLSQKDRKKNLDLFKTGEARFLICTDLAARGIDIKELPCIRSPDSSSTLFILHLQRFFDHFLLIDVINYTLPDKATDYVHRIGRVGRADRTGLAISLVGNGLEKVWFHKNCRGKDSGCNNTKLLEEGGCCMWYNEQQYLKDIEKIAGREIARVNTETARLAETDTIKYGMKRGEADQDQVFKLHAEFLRPIVEELAVMENKAQRGYWSLLKKFDKN